MQINRITISGLPGSGTTTIANLLKKKLNLQYIYAGKIFRKMAEENEMELLGEKEERVRRIIEREGGSLEKKRKEMEEREESEAKRYKNFYGIDLGDLSIYDVVVDTTNISPDVVMKKILEKIKD
ncbi:hypothetical protein B6U81_03145 [Thermoplasmatales archaeon ex4484_30]|nr:MAG: hypothetical protein B6U81_03145 [Thermoplasmatales archaeon ex4484_30]